MDKKIVPTHKYKTTVVFYDDNKDFLNMLKAHLKSDNCKFIFVDNVTDLYHAINNSEKIQNKLPSLKFTYDNEFVDDPKHDAMGFDISKFHDLQMVGNKSDEISTIFIDHDLGNNKYSGLSICEDLKNYNFNRVLLTGNDHKADALNAFSKNHIQLYLDKDSSSISSRTILLDNIENSLSDLADNFFINSNIYTNELLTDSIFKQLFNLVIGANNTTEFYLFDKETFLLLDCNNKPKYLKCWHENKFEEYYELNFDELNLELIKDLNKIQKKQAIPTIHGLQKAFEHNNLFYCLY
jgi:CheY-like chemotaxis protein